jgi:hypothetical protein
MTRGRKHDQSLILKLFVASLLIAAALASHRERHSKHVEGIRGMPSTLASRSENEPIRREAQDNIAGFRLLLTILAGVALGAAASALPTLMSTPASGSLLVSIWLFWTTGVFAVVLVYLSTLTGSKVIPNEIGFAHTTALIASFLAQCGLFASLVRSNAHDSIRWWLISFSSFGVAATVAILLGLWILPKSHREMDREVLAFYRRAQWGDVVMASLSALVPLVYLSFFPEPSDRAALTASIIALTSIVAACMKQSLERRRLRRGGLI